MDMSSTQISHMVFRRVTPVNRGKFSLDSQTLSVLMELDGTKALATVAKDLGVNIAVMREVISKLLQLGLIEKTDEAVSKVDQDFMDFLRSELAIATGPIADILIEDAARDLGYTMTQVPTHRVAELVDMLAREIHREEKMVAFKQRMVMKIHEKGY
jgi:hypothetical protein